RGVDRRRFAGTHHAVNVEQGLLAALVLVELQRVANVRPIGDRIDIEDRQIIDARFDQRRQDAFGKRVTRFAEDLTRFRVDDIFGDVAIEQIFARDHDVLNAVLHQLVGQARRDLLAGFGDDLAGLRVDEIVIRLHAAPALGAVLRGPAGARALVDGV